jgi:hypothetical protein
LKWESDDCNRILDDSRKNFLLFEWIPPPLPWPSNAVNCWTSRLTKLSAEIDCRMSESSVATRMLWKAAISLIAMVSIGWNCFNSIRSPICQVEISWTQKVDLHLMYIVWCCGYFWPVVARTDQSMTLSRNLADD